MQNRHDLSDEQWARLEPLLPDRTPAGGGRWMDHRLVVDAVLWRTRASAAGPAGVLQQLEDGVEPGTADGQGTWRVVLSSLRTDCDQTGADEWVVGVDATVIRAHQNSARARHEPPKDIPAEVLSPVAFEAPIRLFKHTGGSIELHEFR